ncbi:DUF2484 family protein [Ruegeria sp. HKCCD4884]|uniref:DUF2484 family protein n=1 Tax=Ruegeria sp. HKCCD4884 TaxID=2683022 RepID=UPI0014909641|nr:DUF2484 family protein [Ruegeria sp. HKCCD4884]NOD92232.1 DUF2484 family protein [Ruegeria sp. HKCCD4884]
MSWSLALAALWGLSANILAMVPSKDNHWTRAYILIVVGIPILGYVTYQHGPWIGLLVLGMGMSMLRWPVIYLSRWTKAKMQGMKAANK